MTALQAFRSAGESAGAELSSPCLSFVCASAVPRANSRAVPAGRRAELAPVGESPSPTNLRVDGHFARIGAKIGGSGPHRTPHRGGGCPEGHALAGRRSRATDFA